ncbi:hypothetical protein [Mariniflexile sp. AS56]|uniref:hypothetical protein n=1 Tax=Mariniflexile sp. AS56 TaxID=3063957 RepID=UPI0026EFA7CA|nr:hypothetical protein [Mariniflexile sp. AS56]MDO7174258.1 hypothetical protein [Mariniflexile sp. AS56]
MIKKDTSVGEEIEQDDISINREIVTRQPALDLSAAEIAYFEQTRRECDVEKTQKDRALQYAFLVTGGTSVFGLTNLESTSVQAAWSSLLLGFSLLIIVTALMSWRRQKLRAQGYRWVVLYSLIKSGTIKEGAWISLESIIINGIKKNIHGKDDRLFTFGLSLPILSLILWHSYNLCVTNSQYLALIITAASLGLFIWSMFRHSKRTEVEYGIGEIIKKIENI